MTFSVFCVFYFRILHQDVTGFTYIHQRLYVYTSPPLRIYVSEASCLPADGKLLPVLDVDAGMEGRGGEA